MLIIGTFEHSLELEQVLAVLEHGISRAQILVVSMDTAPKSPIKFINSLRDIYAKGIEVGIAFATASSVVGISVGFILAWGPIVWGLFLALIGFIIGFGIYLFFNRNNYRHLPKRLPEVTVIVQCPEHESAIVMHTMWEYKALSVGQTPEPCQLNQS